MPTPKAYYNEWDAKAAAWLRVLIKEGLIADGDVDTRSIREVQPADLQGYTQVHFFAGIGGWSLALRLAGWDDSRPVWTGSCPCQPFSDAGQHKGVEDERHLWPEFARLVAQCNPPTVFGEQVASKDGREWLAGVRSDLEAMGYRVGAADLCAASVSAPHKRQRLWWVADANGGDTSAQWEQRSREQRQQPQDGQASLVAVTEGEQHDGDRAARGRRCQPSDSSSLGNTTSEQVGSARQSWGQSDTLMCADGKSRRVEAGTFPLAHGIPARLGRLRGYGNAIVPQVAAEFIQASIEAMRC